jgi:crotonobetainyl-CoA:carnitine CoA-transferase CaiB-like acyl-CoA transferase
LRWNNRIELYAAIEAFTLQHTKEALRGIFGGQVPFSPIYSAEEIFHDPHFAARNMLPEVEHPGSATPTAVPGVPVKLSVTAGSVRHRAPKLGEHTRDVLKEIGLADTDVDALLRQGAISQV